MCFPQGIIYSGEPGYHTWLRWSYPGRDIPGYIQSTYQVQNTLLNTRLVFLLRRRKKTKSSLHHAGVVGRRKKKKKSTRHVKSATRAWHSSSSSSLHSKIGELTMLCTIEPNPFLYLRTNPFLYLRIYVPTRPPPKTTYYAARKVCHYQNRLLFRWNRLSTSFFCSSLPPVNLSHTHHRRPKTCAPGKTTE